ncbi:hypothetical protein MLD38_008982 [Melastoma candidum]|uniref:Uncharacterized protein n=1 Tax=Melastoma candidum TaxID=119954 RepID=A0ACB9RZS7_9MYRT|nr:hypothetical protein MLD38_008982 [Melastoma candidum]
MSFKIFDIEGKQTIFIPTSHTHTLAVTTQHKDPAPLPPPLHSKMAQKVVLKIMTMTDDKTKQKAIEAAADIYGVDAIAVELKDQKLTVIGTMDTVAVVKKLKKVGKVDIVSVGPAKEEKKGDDKKGEDKKGDDKKGEDKKADDKKAGGGDKK